MTDRQVVATTLALLHQNQVALSESVQLISAWCRRQGSHDLSQGLQPHMLLLVRNALQINDHLQSLLDEPSNELSADPPS